MELKEGTLPKDTTPPSTAELTRKEQDLIEEALKVGRSKLRTWTSRGGDSGSSGYQSVSEEEHPDSTNKYFGSALDFAFKRVNNSSNIDTQTGQLIRQGIREVFVVTP